MVVSSFAQGQAEAVSPLLAQASATPVQAPASNSLQIVNQTPAPVPASTVPAPLPATSTQAVTLPVQIGPPAPAKFSPSALIVATQPTDQEPSLEERFRTLEQKVFEQQIETDDLKRQLSAAQQPPVPPSQQPAEWYRIGSALGMGGRWNNGLEFRTQEDDFYFHIGGRTQWDNVWLGSPNEAAALTNTQQSPNDSLQDAAFFRRGRIRAEGSMYEQFDWCVEYNLVSPTLVQAPNFSGTNPQTPNGNYPNSGTSIRTLENQVINVPQPTDLWWNIRHMPVVGNLSFGNLKEPFSLERLESSRYLDFMERNYGQDAFISPSANGFAPGILIWNWSENKRITYALGAFKVVTNGYVFDVGNGENELAGRLTCLPIYDEAADGRTFMHLGIGAATREINDGQIRYRVRGSLRNGPDPIVPVLADTSYINGHLQNMLCPEFMFQRGPLFIQAEATCNWTTDAFTIPGTFQGGAPNGAPQGTLFFYNYYAQVLYFLTGENRIYDYQKGLVGRVIPYENFFLLHNRHSSRSYFGHGAWQVGARFNYLNLNDKLVRGGTLTDMTIAVNWFFNPNMKLQFNYDVQWRDAGGVGTGGGTEGIIEGFGTRIAADF